MKRCSIIIHSVNGNCYIMGSYLKEKLEERNVEVKFYKVEDPDLHIWANQSETANDFYEDILAMPTVSIEKLEKSDMIIIGCPTIFGNVSAEMKAFLDSTWNLSENKSLEYKLFACFTSCKNSICEGAYALDSMIHWAQNMSMLHIPFGVRCDKADCMNPVSGLLHLEGKEGLIRPSMTLGNDIEYYADNLASFLQD